jgi:hypothetical protein
MKSPSYFVGELTYGEEYQETAGQTLHFSIKLSWLGNEFSGISKDISGRGLSPDEATVNGHLSGDSISYTKKYKRRHFLGADLSTEIHEKPGFPIFYKGNFNSDKNQYEGIWEIVKEVNLLFIKLRWSYGKGTFWLKENHQEIGI